MRKNRISLDHRMDQWLWGLHHVDQLKGLVHLHIDVMFLGGCDDFL